MSTQLADVPGPDVADIAFAAICRLVVSERHCRDRGWWAEMAACFSSAATVQLSWFQGSGGAFVEASRAMSAQGDYAVHHLSPPFIRINGKRALCELPVAIVFLCDLDGVSATLTSRARMQYRVEQIGNEWLIARITSIYEYDALVSRIGGELPGVDVSHIASFRPSYCCLAWYLARKGYTIGDHMLGDDRPEPVAEHYQTEWDWLGRDRQSYPSNEYARTSL